VPLPDKAENIMPNFPRRHLIAGSIAVAVYAVGAVAIHHSAAAWVPGGGYDAISLDRADRQDRAERALQNPHLTVCTKCDIAQGNGGRRNQTPDRPTFNGSDDGNRSGDDAGDQGFGGK
jgi:hypothetical protein